MRRLLVLATVIAMVLALAPAASAGGKGAVQLSGSAVFHAFGFTDDCPGPGTIDGTDYQSDFDEFTLVLDGDLEGCWYTNVLSSKDNSTPSGVYQERGQEIFVGTLFGDPVMFKTEYKFSSKWDPEIATGTEVHGRCQHPIIDGFGDVHSGRVDFKDDVVNEIFYYRGHVKLANGD